MSKIITRLYEYDSTQEANEYRGKDYSKYILVGDADQDNLDDTLDSVALTLVGLPFRKEFSPKTKFIYEKWTTNATGSVGRLFKSWHIEVDNDAVEQPIMSDNHYFNHSITFLEASIDAQGRLVDNIAVTYRLKDVNLNIAPTYDTEAKAIKTISNVEYTPSKNFQYSLNSWNGVCVTGHNFKWVMPDWYQVTLNGVTKTPQWEDWDNIKLNVEIPLNDSFTSVDIPVPMLQCWCGVKNSKGYKLNGYCSIDVIVSRKLQTETQYQIVEQFTVNPAEDTLIDASTNTYETTWQKDTIMGDNLSYGEIVSRVTAFDTEHSAAAFNPSYSKVSQKSLNRTNRVVHIDAESGYTYKVDFKRHVFKDLIISKQLTDFYPAIYSSSKWKRYWVIIDIGKGDNNSPSYINDNYPFTSLYFNAIKEGTQRSIYLANAPTETAYRLYQKAVLCTQDISKQEGVSVIDTKTSYYLEEADKQELQNTVIVESFYNQKNLWEIQLEVGKYIHARPINRFGSDNRYVTQWKRYGRTNTKKDFSTHISIYNSRFVEEYISALSSYVTNMVQLGGQITEIVPPKSTSDDFLVYNDVAEIIVDKKIIEILELKIIKISNSEERDITSFVYEESVYNVLPIEERYNVNKGIAIYYKAGTNKIVGLDYQRPVINTGDQEGNYAIKNIIADVFQIVSDINEIKVNDYLFKITYRTNDSLRSNQVRPDLRKYILSTPYDNVPQHNQFNNQTDIVVDSVKFGNQNYGKLIRTGNTVYSKIEWVDSLENLKQSGELYTIDDELYYVSKVKNTYYDNYIISQVEFSKDFNRLSQIIGIPSEPRFYEISERSTIDREKTADDYLVLCADSEKFHEEGIDGVIVPSEENGCITIAGLYYVLDLLLGNSTNYPKYAVTIFKSDIDTETVTGNENWIVETCTPISTYSLENTLTLEWDMQDNFSGGDQVGEADVPPGTPTNRAYKTLIPFRYCDVYGRADLYDFAIVSDYDFSNDYNQVCNLPQNPIDLLSADILFSSVKRYADYRSHSKGQVLLKDNRETMHFNYNLQLLNDSDRFVFSSYMWQKNKTNLKIGLLNTEINKLSTNIITNNDFLITDIPFTADVKRDYNDHLYIGIDVYSSLQQYASTQEQTLEELLEGVQAIVIYDTKEVNNYVNAGAKYFVFGRNVGDLTAEEKAKDWFLTYLDKDMFPKQ